MNILMVSLDFPPTEGGISAHVYELSIAMKEQNNNLYIVTLNVDGKLKQYEEYNGLHIYRISLKSFGFLYGLEINSFIQKILKKISIDIIHIHGMRPLEFYNIKSIPMVYTNHTSGFLKRIKKGGYRVWLMKRLFDKPDFIIAPSEELLEIPFSVKAKKQFVSNGVVASKFKRDISKRIALRNSLNYSDDDIVAIVTRRMVWKNGLEVLAKATQYIKNKNLKILFIGDGEEKNIIIEYLEQYFNNRYQMLGNKTHQEIIDYYSVADISILPSIMEATSISGLEAMASSLPIVGTRVGGIPVLIEDGVNGYLCESQNPIDLANKIDRLLDSDYKKMGEKSVEFVIDKFDWAMIGKQTLDIYNRIKKDKINAQ